MKTLKHSGLEAADGHVTRLGKAFAAFAEAWRNLQAAKAAMDANREAVLELIGNGQAPMAYEYADGVSATFTVVEGAATRPVGYDEAQTVTGFGHARMAKIAGTVDPKAVRAFRDLGILTDAQAEALLPVEPYIQIRGRLAK